MEGVWAGEVATPEATQKYNALLLERADNKYLREKDQRDFIKYVMSIRPCSRKRSPPQKYYQDACKRMMTAGNYWASPPK